MKRLAEDTSRALATFGISASITTIAYMTWSDSSFLSDDSYIFGMSVGVIVGSILFVTLVCERVWKKKVSLLVCAALYGALAAYAAFVMMTAELHGPGIAAIVLAGSLLLGALELGLMRRVRTLYLDAVGLPLAVTFVAIFIVV